MVKWGGLDLLDPRRTTLPIPTCRLAARCRGDCIGEETPKLYTATLLIADFSCTKPSPALAGTLSQRMGEGRVEGAHRTDF